MLCSMAPWTRGGCMILNFDHGSIHLKDAVVVVSPVDLVLPQEEMARSPPVVPLQTPGHAVRFGHPNRTVGDIVVGETAAVEASIVAMIVVIAVVAAGATVVQ